MAGARASILSLLIPNDRSLYDRIPTTFILLHLYKACAGRTIQSNIYLILISTRLRFISVQSEKINVRLQQAQVFPQTMSMSFLPGEERVVDMEVFAPTKGPLDLYILMDFSNSMADDLNNLKRMGKELGESDV